MPSCSHGVLPNDQGGATKGLFLSLREDHSLLVLDLQLRMVAECLQQAKIDSRGYSTHSFRIGMATSAKDAGISDVHIKMLGRWKSEAYQLYVRLSWQSSQKCWSPSQPSKNYVTSMLYLLSLVTYYIFLYNILFGFVLKLPIILRPWREGTG